MAHRIYYSNTLDENGELHFERHDEEAVSSPAELDVQKIVSRPAYPCPDDPTLASFYEPLTDEERNNSKQP